HIGKEELASLPWAAVGDILLEHGNRACSIHPLDDRRMVGTLLEIRVRAGSCLNGPIVAVVAELNDVSRTGVCQGYGTPPHVVSISRDRREIRSAFRPGAATRL